MPDNPNLPHGEQPTGGSDGLRPGSVLGNYRLEEPLGRGGMGLVWKAWDTAGERAVALKFLPPEFTGNDDAIAQVKQTFKIVHALTHQHIGKTIGMLNDPMFGPYVVLDYLPGIPLSKFIRVYRKQIGVPTVDLVRRLLQPVAAALDHAHFKGVLHRDVKPGNILVEVKEGRPGDVWLIDFGLAAEISSTLSKISNGVDNRGTLPYQAPEQVRGKRNQWNGRTDQYALAVVAYELLAGHLPFEGDAMVLMLAILNEPPDPIAGQSEGVNAALLKALSKQKEERFATCCEFVEALVAGPTPSPAPPPRPEPKTTERPATLVDRLQGSKAGDVLELADRRFRWCPPGTFTMGTPGATDDERPVSVTLTRGFWLCETTVTQSQWQSLMGSTPWKQEDYVKEGPLYPATYVSWEDAVGFCRQLTAQERGAGRIAPGWAYRLPTEAQWEYACRAGTTTKYSFGDSDDRLGDDAWYHTNAYDIGEKYAHEVGRKRANPWGLYDMHGNVWEWCGDWYDSKLTGGTDPVGPSQGSNRVYRGGGWGNSAGYCRSAYRGGCDPSGRSGSLGFRVCLSSD